MSSDDQKPDIVAATFDDLDDLLTHDDAPVLVIELGGRGHFRASDVVRAAEALSTAVGRLRDSQTLILTIGGYDTDKRELYEVPEVVRFLRRTVKAAGITHWSHPAVRMFNEETLALLLQCGVFGSDHPWRVQRTEGRPPVAETFRRHHSGGGR
jgi:hypothetical protein